MTDTATTSGLATLVPEARRMAFLPALFSPALMLIGERAVYQFMSWLAPDDYTGVVCGRGRNPTLRLWPAIFSGEIDVFPSERRNMGQEIGR